MNVAAMTLDEALAGLDAGHEACALEVSDREAVALALDFARDEQVAALRDALDTRRLNPDEIAESQRIIGVVLDGAASDEDETIAFYARQALESLERWHSDS